MKKLSVFSFSAEIKPLVIPAIERTREEEESRFLFQA